MKKSEHLEERNLFNKQLYENFENSGILHDLKAKMRYDLVSRLKSNKENENENVLEEVSPLNFQKKLFNNIISDYLRFENLNYSYSIFLNETKLVNNMLTRQEISDYFSKTSKIFRSSTKFQENLSIIHNLLEILCDKKLEKYFLNCHTQTDCDSIKNNFNLNLQSIDNNYIDKLSYYKLGAVSNVEEQMNNYKRNLEARYQADLEAELSKFKEYELANIRFEESQKNQKKMEEFKQQNEKKYLENFRKIKEREDNAIKLCKSKISEIEKKEFENRQILLNELEKIKKREIEITRHNCLDNEELKQEKKKIQNLEEDLQRKIQEYDSARESLQNKMLDDISQRKFLVKSEVEKKSAINLQKELEREREFLKQNTEALKNYEIQRDYLSKENEFLSMENKELEIIRHNQQETILNLRTSINNLKSQLETQYRIISTKNSEIDNLKVESSEYICSIRNLKEVIEKMRYEANETIKNHEKSMEKYQQLMKKKIQDAHQKTRIQKKTTNFTDFEIMYQDDGKKREYEKTVGEFFDKIKEMRKERSFFGEIDDIEESLIENEASFHINEKKQEFLLQNNKIEGGNIKKPHLTDMSKIIEKTNEQHNNKSDISDIYTNSLKKSVINEKYQIKEETYMDKTNNSFAQKSNLKKIDKQAINNEKTPSIDQKIEKKVAVNSEEVFSKFKSDSQLKNQLDIKNQSSNIESPDNFSSNFIKPPKDISFENKDKKDLSMNLQRDKFPINNEEISLNSEFLFEKESASNKQFGKKSLEALLPRFPEKTKSLTTLKFEEQKYEKTDKLSNPKEEIFGKNISLNEISNKHTNTSDKKNEEISGKNLFMMEQAHENKETILKNPYKKEIGKEENKKFVEKEPALKLNFFEKPKFPSVSSQSLSSLEKKQIESPSKNREKSQTDIKLNIAKDNQGFEKSTFSQFNLIANEKKNEIKAGSTPTKKEKIEMTQKDEIDDFDDLLGELEFMTNVPRKKESSLIEIKKSEKVSPLFYEKAKETSKNLSIIENEKKKNEMKKDIVENLKEIVKNTSVNDKMKDSKKEIDEEIEEDIDFGEIDEEDLFD